MGPKCKRYEGKTALITAATAGIGFGIAKRLGEEGAQLVICSRRQGNVDEAVAKLKGEGIKVVGTAAHVGSKADVERLVKLAIDTYGKIDLVVSNAAVNPSAGLILDMPDSAIHKILEINVFSPILLLKEVRPYLKKGSSIVFISSYTAYRAVAPIAMYAVSKTALVALSNALAMELGPEGIRVNCVAPGTVPTKFASALVEDPELAKANASSTYLGRLGTPEDMAAAVAYLGSDDASYVTGETIVVSGGMHSRL
eukprot:jgi/Botrbrau1/1812/Bobra.146_1s0010.1